MKRLLLMVVCMPLNFTSMHCNVLKKNMQLCLNTPRDFGTKHFIVGYKEKDIPVQAVSGTQEKKQAKHAANKRHDALLGGADLIDKNRTTQSFFTTVHDISDILLSIISQAKKGLYISAFTLTDSRIANQIIEKYKNRIDVCVIVDAGNMDQAHSKVQLLIDNNVPVWRYNPALNPQYKKNGFYKPLMHHKCIRVDDEIVVTGSTNLTKAGQKHNIENINILRDTQAINEHRAEFERLKKYCVECKSHNVE